MPRAIWKGAISFGLVHIPVKLSSATASQGVDFDWLDKRSMDPVGYKRINKVTGKEVSKEQIVKGVEFERDRYVVISEEEIRAAHPKSTQTIDIFSFVDSEKIPLPNIDTPYYLSPDKRGEKVYALLRETLKRTSKVALALVVLHTRQHLAALMPMDSALVLVLLRWPAEVRELASIELDESVTQVKLNKAELEMAERLVKDMTADWKPKEYQDTFTEKIMQLVEKKARDGKVENVERTEMGEERKTADILDLTELLKRSLGGRGVNKAVKKSGETIDTTIDETTHESSDKPGSKTKGTKGEKKVTSKSTTKSSSSRSASKPAKKSSTPAPKPTKATPSAVAKRKPTRVKAARK